MSAETPIPRRVMGAHRKPGRAAAGSHGPRSILATRPDEGPEVRALLPVPCLVSRSSASRLFSTSAGLRGWWSCPSRCVSWRPCRSLWEPFSAHSGLPISVLGGDPCGPPVACVAEGICPCAAAIEQRLEENSTSNATSNAVSCCSAGIFF